MHGSKTQKLGSGVSYLLNSSFEGPSRRHAEDLSDSENEEEELSTTSTRNTRRSEDLPEPQSIYSRGDTYLSYGNVKFLKRHSTGHIMRKRGDRVSRTSSLSTCIGSLQGVAGTPLQDNGFAGTRYFQMMEDVYAQVSANNESTQDYIEKMKKTDYMWRIYVAEITEHQAFEYPDSWLEYDLSNPSEQQSVHEVTFDDEQSVQWSLEGDRYLAQVSGREVQRDVASVEREFSKFCDVDFERQRSGERAETYRHVYNELQPQINAVLFQEPKRRLVRVNAPFSISRLGQKDKHNSHDIQVSVDLKGQHPTGFTMRLLAHYDPRTIEKFKIIKLLVPSAMRTYHDRDVYLKVGFCAAPTKRNFVFRTKKMADVMSSIDRNAEATEKLAQIKLNIRTTGTVFTDLVKEAKTPFDERLALGSIISNLLQAPDIKGKDQLGLLRRNIRRGQSKLKFVVLQPCKWRLFQRVMVEMAGNEPIDVKLGRLRQKHNITPYNLSEKFNKKEASQIDYFVSHCWGDDPLVKFEKLCELSETFKQEHGRYPRMWIDVFCINQTKNEVQESLNLLPVYLMACEKFLVLKSQSYFSRLWCLAELLPRFVFTKREEEENGEPKKFIEYISLDDEKIPDDLDISSAQCGKKEDQAGVEAFLYNIPGITKKEIGKYVYEAMTTGANEIKGTTLEEGKKRILLNL